MRGAGLLLVAALAAACGAQERVSLPDAELVEDRERLADQKIRDRDPSAIQEYRVAIGIATSRMRTISTDMRDELFAAQNPPRGAPMRDLSGYADWRNAVNQLLLAMSPEERQYFTGLVRELSSRERENLQFRYSRSSSFEREAAVRRLQSDLPDWRRLAQAVRRMEAKCREC